MDLRKRLRQRLLPKPLESAPRLLLLVNGCTIGLMCLESAGKYFSQENPVIREITKRVQTM